MKSQFEEIPGIEEDCKQYTEILLQYTIINETNIHDASKLCVKALVLADRWSDIQSNAKKIAALQGLNKTDLSAWCYQKHRMLMKLHEHARSIWKSGSDNLKSRNGGY